MCRNPRRRIRSQMLILRCPDKTLMIDPVAFAGGRLEAVAIPDRDLAVMVADYSRALQLASSHGHPCAPHAEHRGEELVRHRHDIRLNAVVRHEQPTGASLLDFECSRLQAAVWALRFMRAVAKRSTAMRTAALSSKAALHRAASIRSAVPGIWTMTCGPGLALPKTADTPTQPSDRLNPTPMPDPSSTAFTA